MKISIEIQDEKYSFECSDEVKFHDFMENLNRLLKCVYSETTVNKYWED